MRVVVTILLMTSVATAHAEWVEVLDFGDRSLYYETAIKKVGDYRRAWTIHNLKERDKSGASSLRYLDEYDCGQGRVRILSFSAHSEHMAGGNTIESNDRAENWSYTPPGTIGAKLLEIICR